MNEDKKSMKPGRVALYARVSSDKQAQEGTIDSQVSLLRAQISADGCPLEAALCFIDDGVSGATLVRPALERLRDQAAAGALDRLYVLAPDRLARRHAHQMVLVEELQACGVAVVFTNRPVGNTPEDQLLLQVQGVVAEYERAKILERTRRGRLHAARCGRVSVLGHAPFGYRYLDKQKGGGLAAYEVVEEEARLVRQMFAWVACEGCSLREVGRRLEKLGVLTRHGQRRWDPGTIAGMLSNPTYYGQAAYGKTRRGERRPRLRPFRGQPEIPKLPYSQYARPAAEHIAIAVPALIDADLFATVQERFAENRRRWRGWPRGRRYLLQGLVVCQDKVRETEELRLVFSRLDDFADQMNAGLHQADWSQQREILRALVKRVEVDKATIRIVYKVPERPFVKAPQGGLLQDCWSRYPVNSEQMPTLSQSATKRGDRWWTNKG